MLFPVTFLGMYSPFAIRLLMQSRASAGSVSGTVYGISTAGSILGTLATTFVLIPLIGTRAITIALGISGLFGGVLLIAASSKWRRLARLGVLAALLASQAAMSGDFEAAIAEGATIVRLGTVLFGPRPVQ